MKNYLFLFIILIFISLACSKSKEIVKEDRKEESTQRYTPPPTTTRQNNYNRPREGTISAAEIQRIEQLASQKALYECKIEKLEQQGTSNQQQAEINKEMVIVLDGKLKVLQVDIDKFLDTKEKIQYFRRAFNQAIYNCRK